ncbi:hypothetical protein HerbRD11066_09830 [Herbidospora sp. RD11066]
MVVSDHVPHGQILDRERLVLAHQSSGDLVQMISPSVGDTRMDAGESRRGPAAVGRPRDLAGKAALRFGEALAISSFVA